MLYNSRKFLLRIWFFSFCCLAVACHGRNDKSVAYDQFKFDPAVISKLPLYDSLASAIIDNFPAFSKFIKKDDGYRAFRYMPSSKEADMFIKLPPEAAPGIDPIFNQIGKDFITGFDLFKDSSIKIYIRSTYVDSTREDIEENLSYVPPGKEQS